jgi:hypothetical protein
VVKKVAAASVLSTEAFSTAGLALQVEVGLLSSISGLKVREDCWNSDLDARLEEVAATSKSVRLQETLPTTSQVLDLYESHHVT